MDDSILGVKELYDVTIRAYDTMKINNKLYLKGEVVCCFDKIALASMDESKRNWSARGGVNNRLLVTWDLTLYASIRFNLGVFSKTQLSLLTNSNMILQTALSLQLIPWREELETDENFLIELKKQPAQELLFIYNKMTGARITNYSISGKIITLSQSYLEVIVDYYSIYNNDSTLLKIGIPATSGFLRLEGKTRVKDDNTGHIVTGIFIIPRLRLKTGLSILLGSNAIPMVGTFYGEGYPAGGRGESEVCELLILSDEIDSDI